MFNLLRYRVKHNRVALRLLTPLLVLCSLLAPPAAVSVQGQSCRQGGSALCTLCWTSYNIIWDPAFHQTSCTAWQFDPQAERVLTGTYCGSGNWSAPYARFNGPSQWWDVIYQSTEALAQPEWDHFIFSYTYDINDPANHQYTMLEVWIRHNGYWYFVDSTPSGSQQCVTRQVDLGRRPEWVGQPLEVHFWAYQPGSSNIVIGVTSLSQTFL